MDLSFAAVASFEVADLRRHTKLIRRVPYTRVARSGFAGDRTDRWQSRGLAGPALRRAEYSLSPSGSNGLHAALAGRRHDM
jgi:hypothetical protein